MTLFSIRRKRSCEDGLREISPHSDSSTELGDSELEGEAKSVINAAIKADLFRVINDEDQISLMEFEIPYSRRSYDNFKEDYLEKNAKEKAYEAAIEEFRKKRGFRKLNEF